MLHQLCRIHKSNEQVALVQKLLRSNDQDKYDKLVKLAGSWKQLQSSEHETFVLNQFAALIKKYPWGKRIKADPEATARKKFFAAEHLCHRTNQRFLARRSCRPTLNEDILSRMRAFITYVIGHSPDIQDVFNNSAFGPGASIGVSRSTNVARKLLASKYSVTPGAFIYGYVAIMNNTHFRGVLSPETAPFSYGDADFAFERKQYRSKTCLVNHNKIAFVPKTALVHRTIAIEPLLNGYIQKGVDVVMKRKLKRVGLDLGDQSLNQEFARQGSIPGQANPFVTIDLSSASDSIAIEVVREVLPPDWFEFLNSLRSAEFEMDGSKHRYHKFCSMGNGFCFPLETLIFAAACNAVQAGTPGKDFLVYGDDIIVRQSRAKALIEVLNFLGFRINADKTFLEGPFRESCGADWYEGVDIRPFTLDFELDQVQNVFKALNLSRRNERTELFFSSIRPFLIGLLPLTLRFYRPHKGNADTGIDGTGDEHLLSEHCIFDRRNRVWMCRELITSALPDNFWKSAESGDIPLMWAALVGAASTMPFSFRSKTRTKVRLTACSEATSQWLPPVSKIND